MRPTIASTSRRPTWTTSIRANTWKSSSTLFRCISGIDNPSRARILDNLRDLPHAPSVNNQDVPPDLLDSDDENEDDDDPDERFPTCSSLFSFPFSRVGLTLLAVAGRARRWDEEELEKAAVQHSRISVDEVASAHMKD